MASAFAALKDHGIRRLLGVDVDGPHHVPASEHQSLHEVPVDAGVGKEGLSAGHYRLRKSARSASMRSAASRSRSRSALISCEFSW
jgi:hypothetical protein